MIRNKMRILFSRANLRMTYLFKRPDKCKNEICRTGTGSFVYGLGG